MKKLVSVALAAAALAAPAAIASARGNEHRAQGPRMVEYVVQGVVAANASNVAVDLADARGLSKPARRALAGASTVSIKLDANTRFRGRHGLKGVAVKLMAGDRVRILIRAPRGLAAAALPAALVVINRGPAPGAETMPTPAPPVEAPAPPVVEPAPVLVLDL